MTLATILLIAAATTGTINGTIRHLNEDARKKYFNESYANYQKAVKTYKLDDLNTKDVIEDLWQAGVIDEQKYKKSLTQYSKLEDLMKSDGSISDAIGDDFAKFTTGKKTYKEAGELYKLIAENAKYLNGYDAQKYDELVNSVNQSFYTSLPTIADAPTPQYLDTLFEGTQIEETKVKDWSAKELAELHNINYDPNYYYDLIKQGTEANIAHGEFTNRQLDTLANSQDTKNIVGYLDSIRNAKAEALANGATMGAKAAAEVLANSEAFNQHATTQAQLANTKANNMQDLLLADASAGITAKQYFNQLAQSLTTDATNLYTYDSDRYGQELLTNAELYTADQALRGAREIVNANMYRNQLETNAQIAYDRAAAQAQADQYSWLFNNGLRAYNGDAQKALHTVSDYIFQTYNKKDRMTHIYDSIK